MGQLKWNSLSHKYPESALLPSCWQVFPEFHFGDLVRVCPDPKCCTSFLRSGLNASSIHLHVPTSPGGENKDVTEVDPDLSEA